MMIDREKWNISKRRYEDTCILQGEGKHLCMSKISSTDNTAGKFDECFKEAKENLADKTISVDWFIANCILVAALAET